MKTRNIIPQLWDFWGVPTPDQPQPGIQYYHLNDDPHDPENWRLIALRFPDLAALLPVQYVGSKSPSIDSHSQLQQDIEAVRHLGQGASLADISEILTGKRTYGGAVYQRVKEVQQALKTSTTTPSEPGNAGSRENKAA